MESRRRTRWSGEGYPQLHGPGRFPHSGRGTARNGGLSIQTAGPFRRQRADDGECGRVRCFEVAGGEEVWQLPAPGGVPRGKKREILQERTWQRTVEEIVDFPVLRIQ